MADDGREHLAVVLLRPVLGGEHDRAGAVVHARRVAGGVRAVLDEDRLELRERLERRVTPRRLVDLDRRLALLRLDCDGDDLLGQATFVGCLDRQLVRAQRELVEVGARHLELGRNLGRLVRHVLAAERVRQPVVDHGVERLRVAHPVAEASVLQQVRGVRHRLHAARDADVHVTRPDRLVDRLRRDLLRDPALDLRLPRRDLALARLQHLAHDHVLDLVRRYLGAFEGGLDGLASEGRGVERRERAAELAEGGSRGSEDRGLGHVLIRLPLVGGVER